MSLRKTFEEKGVWELVYVVGFYAPILGTISDLVENTVERVPLIIIGLVLGTSLGLGIYRFVRTKTNWTKSAVLIMGIVSISLLSIPLTSFFRRLTYDTCDVCGFVAMNKKTHECQVCASDKWDSSMTGYTSKEQYVKEEQLFWFSTRGSDEKVNFYLPEDERNESKFPKDETWKPIVTEMEVIEYSRNDP